MWRTCCALTRPLGNNEYLFKKEIQETSSDWFSTCLFPLLFLALGTKVYGDLLDIQMGGLVSERERGALFCYCATCQQRRPLPFDGLMLLSAAQQAIRMSCCTSHNNSNRSTVARQRENDKSKKSDRFASPPPSSIGLFIGGGIFAETSRDVHLLADQAPKLYVQLSITYTLGRNVIFRILLLYIIYSIIFEREREREATDGDRRSPRAKNCFIFTASFLFSLCTSPPLLNGHWWTGLFH